MGIGEQVPGLPQHSILAPVGADATGRATDFTLQIAQNPRILPAEALRYE